MSRLLFVFNARSGKAQIKNQLVDIIDLFVKAGYEVTVHPTQDRLDAFNVLRDQGNNYDLVVCSGGDGTLNETVSGMMAGGIKTRLGYIPTGTTNDFATSLGISKNMLQATNTIISGVDFNCDVGSFNDSYFTYISAFGAFTEVAYQTPQQTKNILGHLAYVLEGIKRLSSIKTYHMEIQHDGITIEDDFIFGMVSNSMSVGGFKGYGDLGIVLDDGLFEVAFIKMPKNPIDLQMTINHLIKLQVDSNYIYFFRTSALKVTSIEEVPWTLDGEFGGNAKDVVIKNISKAITIIRNPCQDELLLSEEN